MKISKKYLLIAFGATFVFLVMIYVALGTIKEGEHVDLFTRTTKTDARSQVKPLPAELGNVALRTTVLANGNPLPHAQVVFVFQDGYQSSTVTADSAGQIEWRFPVGEWRVLPPIVGGQRSQGSYMSSGPELLKSIVVEPGPVIKTVETKIVVKP